MVKHIVLYTLKEGVDKDNAVEIIRSVLEPLVGVIPGLSIWRSAKPIRAEWTMLCTRNLKVPKT